MLGILRLACKGAVLIRAVHQSPATALDRRLRQIRRWIAAEPDGIGAGGG